LELKVLSKDKFIIAAPVNRGKCKLEDELIDGTDESTLGQRLNVLDKLNRISSLGMDGDTNIWLKCLDSKKGVYEIKSGVIRIFCVKGNDGLLLICTSLLRKTTRKANKLEIDRAAEVKKNYDEAYKLKSIKLIEDKTDDKQKT
jgi:hypothetical protein